ncbi:GNAT family N-acetyltransferase [Tumebacillus permanentifrigoris]|uniref:Putative acetyltransferase n=1 Tax=Tumebacillus permanentifrigoris TaxID=378543 RepID=A0A316D7N7_9BACL|nr:GNAT family N-acetyltransferase [Tumebacillus permanentifrigoris]PWK12743.1 putative acetyltransferase [Tumebacillus permanentifrigoris]
MGLTIRVVRASDAERIYEMGLQENVLPYVSYSPSMRLETIQEQYNQPNPHQHQFVAELDGVVVGLIGLTTFTGRRAHIGYLYLYVDQACHGQGVGSAMFTKIIDLADNWLRLERLELVVLSSNPHAQALYERFGFGVEGRKVAANFVQGKFEDEILMARFRPAGELSHNQTT